MFDVPNCCSFADNLVNYWTYKGSLTTPPCSESVQWVVFCQPIKISREQVSSFNFDSITFKATLTTQIRLAKLEKCHQLYDAAREEDCNMTTLIKYNDRPVCQMGDRILYKSFH